MLLQEQVTMPRRARRPGQPEWNHELFDVDVQVWLLEHPDAQLADLAHACQFSVSTLNRLRTAGQDPAWSNSIRISEVMGREPEEYDAKSTDAAARVSAARDRIKALQRKRAGRAGSAQSA